jgi:hypothetical protein
LDLFSRFVRLTSRSTLSSIRYSKLAFPRAQFDPEPVYATMTAVAAGEIDTYRNLEPKSMLAETKGNIEAVWDKKIRDGLGIRPPSVQKSYEMKPETLYDRSASGSAKTTDIHPDIKPVFGPPSDIHYFVSLSAAVIWLKANGWVP